MTCNYSATCESKTWCSLGFRGYEQDRQRRSRTTTASDEGRSAAVGRNGAGRGCPQGRGHAHDGERVESASDRGRPGRIAAPAAWPAAGSGCTAASRSGPAAEGWSARPGICHGTVDIAARRPADRREVGSPIQRKPGVADSGVAGIQQPAADRRLFALLGQRMEVHHRHRARNPVRCPLED